MRKIIVGVILFGMSISSAFALSDVDQKTIESNNKVIQYLEKQIALLKSKNAEIMKKEVKPIEEKHYFNGVLINEYKGRGIMNPDGSCFFKSGMVHYKSIDYVSIYRYDVIAVNSKCSTRSLVTIVK